MLVPRLRSVAIRETREREIKLRAGEELSRSRSSAARRLSRGSSSRPITTPRDHRLARRGVTLPPSCRERKRALATEAAGRAGAARAGEARRCPLAPPSELLGLLVGHLRGAPLAPIARLRTRREGVRADGAEIVHDNVAVLDNQRVTRSFDELEVELLDGDEKTLPPDRESAAPSRRRRRREPAEGLPGARPGLPRRCGRAAGGCPSLLRRAHPPRPPA